MRRFCLLLCLFLVQSLAAQKLLKGLVVDEKNAPIPKASVFLNNTSIGTMADNAGRFTLSIPSGKFDLVVSSVGFVTFSQSITSAVASDELTIRLKKRLNWKLSLLNLSKKMAGKNGVDGLQIIF
jgi:hypothetical protein